MDVCEVIILPLPESIRDIVEAAEAYLKQYGVVAQLAIRGTIGLDGGQVAVLPNWRTIVQIDELRLIGIGEFGDPDEDLLWAVPKGPGELKVTALEEEM